MSRECGFFAANLYDMLRDRSTRLFLNIEWGRKSIPDGFMR